MSVAPYSRASSAQLGRVPMPMMRPAPPQPGTGHRHQAHRADAEHDHGVTQLDIGHFRAVETGAHHIDGHQGGVHAHVLRQQHQVGVRVVHVEKFRKHAVLLGQIFEAGHAGIVMGIVHAALLQGRRFPVGGDAGYHHDVTRAEAAHQSAHLHHLGHRFVPQDHRAAGGGAHVHGVGIGRAGRHRNGAHHRIHRPGRRFFTLQPAMFARSQYCITFHRYNLFSEICAEHRPQSTDGFQYKRT